MAGDPAGPAELADDLPLWELVQSFHPVARGFTEVFAAAGLTATQFGVLVALREGGQPSQAELARRVLVRPQSVGELLGSLVDRGLVTREGGGARGRRARLEITAEGHRALARSVPAVNAYNAPDALGISSEEVVTLTRLLRRVRAHLGEAP